MANGNYSVLKDNIDDYIKQNGDGDITGQVLQTQLFAMITSLGAGYQYMGVAKLTPTPTDPGSPDQNVFYVAFQPGIYSNFGSQTVADGEIAILKWNGSWTKEVTGAASAAKLDELGQKVDNIQSGIALGGALSLKKVSFPNPGRYLTNGTLSQTGWHHTDLIEVDNSTPVSVYVNEGGSTSTPVVIYYDENQSQIGYELAQGTSAQFVTRSYTAPANTKYIRAQSSGDETKAFVTYQRTTDGLFELEDDIAAAQAQITTNTAAIAALDTQVNLVNGLFAPWLLNIVGFARTNGTIATNTGYHRTDFLDVTNIKRVSLYIAGNAVPAIVWFDANKDAVGYDRLPDATAATLIATKPAGARYMIISVNDSNIPIVSGSAVVNSTKECVFLSPTGADNNTGLEDSPLATAFAAKARGASKIIFKTGDYFDFLLDFGQFKDYEFRKGARLICGTRFSTAELASGYTRVYQVAYATAISASFLWQHDVADAATLIDADEYLPMYHCGKTHRLSSTRLYKAASVADIESTTDKYMWYQTGGILYFSAPSTDFATHPIVIPDSERYETSIKNAVNMVGLTILYRGFKSYKLSGRFNGGFIGFAGTTGFMTDSNEYIEINNFEAAGCVPDGFGGGMTDNVAYDVLMHNCYGHDNADDGESGHIKTCVTQFGGLYEYNGSGVTPAVGAQGSYYGTICRFNGVHDWTVGYQDGQGFSAAMGTDPKTYFLAVGCLSQGNKYGFNAGVNGTSLCINCVAKDILVTAYSGVQQINCTTE